MKLKTILAFGLATLLMTACQKDEGIDYNPMEGVSYPIVIDNSIDQQYISRVDDGGFCEGDQVGLYGVNYTNDNTQAGTLLDEGNQVDNARYTYDEAALTWHSQGGVYYKNAETNIDLYAYYPYDHPASVNAYAFEVAQDQSGKNAHDGFAISDFLWAKAENITPSEAKVKLRFSHRLACAHVVLVEGEGFAAGEFDALEKSLLVMNTTRTAAIDLATGVATATGEAPSEGIVMKSNAEGFRAIVVPQTVEAGKALFSITLDGIAHRFKMSEGFVYEAGKQSKFSIRLNKKGHTGEVELQLINTEIVEWVADLDTHGGEARQYYVVHQEEPGTLGQLLRAAKKNPNKIKNLKVSGKINALDFYFMCDSMEILQAINLKETRIIGVTRDDLIAAGYSMNYDSSRFGYQYQYSSSAEQMNAKLEDDEIPLSAFYNSKNGAKKSLVYFEFPENLKAINESAFVSSNLTGNIVIPNGVVEISGFSNTNITGIQLPYGLKVLNGFEGCTSLSGTLTIPETVEEIGTYAFRDCSGLTGNLVIPSKVKRIKDQTFNGCSGFTGNLVIPEGVEYIGRAAFMGCSGMTGTLTLPESLKELYNGDLGSFRGCRFTGELVIPSKIIEIPASTFYGCQFSHVVFPEGLIKIGTSAFWGNTRLTQVLEFPESLVAIEKEAFLGCETLPGIILPSSLASIQDSAFKKCCYITKIVSNAVEPPAINAGAFDGVPKDSFTVEVPEQSVPRYQADVQWGQFRRISAHYDFVISRPLMRTLNAPYSKNYLLRVPSGEAWQVESKPEWVTVTPASGVGRTEVLITVSEMEASEVGIFEINTGSYESPVYETHSGRSGEIVFLLNEKDYRSTMTVEQYDYDYSDGEVMTNQTATVGGGVNIVFMGDCFDARDIATGSYLNGINEAIGYYFAIEPYKSYKEYFNIYTVVGMSDDSGMGSVNTVKDAKFGSQYSLEGIAPDTEATYEYAMKAATVDEGNLNRTLVVMVENTEDYGGICYMWGDGSAIAVCPMSRDAYPYDFRGIVQHEAGGHGFAKLADEYIYHNAFIQSCTCPCCKHLDAFNDGKALGWYRNLSTNADYHTVEWAHLFAHPDYTNVVDMYEGGYFHSRGIYRSEANSCMNNNVPYYSAIQRQEMVERIKRYAGEEFSIEDFYANDVRDASNNDFVTRTLVEKASAGQAASAQKQLPPKFMGDSPLLR